MSRFSQQARTRFISRIALFAVLIAAGGLLAIPIPWSPAPLTLANLFVTLSGLVLGAGGGVAANALYLVAGTVGVPVFSGGSAGIAHIIGPTGGFLLGYPLSAAAAGAVLKALSSRSKRTAARQSAEQPDADRQSSQQSVPSFFDTVSASLVAMCVLYVPGLLWLAAQLELSIAAAGAVAVLPFLAGDLLKAFVAAQTARVLLRAKSAQPDRYGCEVSMRMQSD